MTIHKNQLFLKSTREKEGDLLPAMTALKFNLSSPAAV